MKLIEDYQHEYEGFTGAKKGICRIRIFSNEDKTKIVGICSALPENYTTSTTNRIEYIYQDVKAKLFEQTVKKPKLSAKERFSSLESLSKDIDGKKYWSLAIQVLKVSWECIAKFKKNENYVNHQELLWVDHWPKEIGSRPWENEFSIIKFDENIIPNWIHITEESFISLTGIDLRYINELELVSENEI